MKTIFIIVSRGILARNFFGTGILARLRQSGKVKMVIVVPEGSAELLSRELNDPELIFEEYASEPVPKFKKVFIFFLRFSLITKTGMNLAWHGSGKARQYRWLYAVAFPLLLVLSVIPYIREFFQYLEHTLYPVHGYDALFARHAPSAVIVTNIAGQIDIAFIKTARRLGIKSIGMTKGWDNLDKYHLQVKADKLIVQSDPLLSYAVRYQGYDPKDVFVGGFPSFDAYEEVRDTFDRTKLCAEFGLDPARKILFFGSEGVWSANDIEIATKLASWINDGTFTEPCSLILRPHFSDTGTHPFNALRGQPHVYVYDAMRATSAFNNDWYPDAAEAKLFAEAMHAIDVMICVRSTLSLDAIACDKPVINLTKRLYIDKRGNDATMNLYKHIFYADLLKRHAIALAGTDSEVIDAINRYLLNPALDGAERSVVRAEYCGKEGAPPSYARIAGYILSEV